VNNPLAVAELEHHLRSVDGRLRALRKGGAWSAILAACNGTLVVLNWASLGNGNGPVVSITLSTVATLACTLAAARCAFWLIRLGRTRREICAALQRFLT